MNTWLSEWVNSIELVESAFNVELIILGNTIFYKKAQDVHETSFRHS